MTTAKDPGVTYGSLETEAPPSADNGAAPPQTKPPSARPAPRKRRPPRFASSPALLQEKRQARAAASTRALLYQSQQRHGDVLSQLFHDFHRPAAHGGGGRLPPPTSAAARKKAPPSSSLSSDRSALYNALNPKSHRRSAVFFKNFISTVIVVDLAFFVLSTEPELKKHKKAFYIMEGVTSSIFLIEYVARLIVATESRRYGRFGPVLGRMRYLVSVPALIDAFATLPFFVELVTGWDLPTLTYLRFFRLLRILKTGAYSKALGAVNRVIFYNREILYVAIMVCVLLVLFTAVLMYYLRPPGDTVDADNFKSIASTMYLSTLMLTGQGGPEGDLPWYTKGVVLLTGVFSVAMFAIPASMLTWGFEAEAERLAKRCATRSRRAGSSGMFSSSSSSSSYSSSDDDDGSESSLSTSDEEYLKIIGGDDDEGDGAAPPAALPTPAEKGPTRQLMMEHIMRLEAKVDETNARLDKIVTMLKGR